MKQYTLLETVHKTTNKSRYYIKTDGLHSPPFRRISREYYEDLSQSAHRKDCFLTTETKTCWRHFKSIYLSKNTFPLVIQMKYI